MSRDLLLQELEREQLKGNIPDFHVGDTVSVQVRIVEGEKERTQVFTGIVIARKGSGLSERFTVYRVVYGVGMERLFYLHSPRISDIEVVRFGKVRRAKLYYLRGRSGKLLKVKEKIVARREKGRGKSKAPHADR